MATPLERSRQRFEERERKILRARELRDKGMTQFEIARELEISQPSVAVYLRLTEPTKKESRKAS